MKIKMQFYRREGDGTKREFELTGDYGDYKDAAHKDLKMLWDMEQAINSSTNVRCHISLEGESIAEITNSGKGY